MSLRDVIVTQRSRAETIAIIMKEREGGGSAGRAMRELRPSRAADFPRNNQHRKLSRGLTELKNPDGGFSIDMKNGHEPQHGFMAALQGREHTQMAHEVSIKDLHQYVHDNADALAKKDIYLGGWHDPKDGKAYLDVSRNFATREEAVAFGRSQHQKAIYNLLTRQSEEI